MHSFNQERLFHAGLLPSQLSNSTDKAPSLAKAISELKEEGICPSTVEHRQVKYLNNVLEGDHDRLKRILGPKGAFKNLDICISDAEGDGSDALLAERPGHDVCPHGQPNPDAVIVSRVFENV